MIYKLVDYDSWIGHKWRQRQMAPKGLELQFCHFCLLVLQAEFNIIGWALFTERICVWIQILAALKICKICCVLLQLHQCNHKKKNMLSCAFKKCVCLFCMPLCCCHFSVWGPTEVPGGCVSAHQSITDILNTANVVTPAAAQTNSLPRVPGELPPPPPQTEGAKWDSVGGARSN